MQKSQVQSLTNHKMEPLGYLIFKLNFTWKNILNDIIVTNYYYIGQISLQAFTFKTINDTIWVN